MLVNAVETVEPVASRLRHVSLMQGYKVYGAHLGPFKTPARETDPHHMPPEFNVDQQAFLEDRQHGRAWSWSAIRPSVVCGFSLGNPMNLAMVIAVYARTEERRAGKECVRPCRSLWSRDHTHKKRGERTKY